MSYLNWKLLMHAEIILISRQSPESGCNNNSQNTNFQISKMLISKMLISKMLISKMLIPEIYANLRNLSEEQKVKRNV